MNKILTDAEILLTAPSVFATQAWEGVSSRYVFIPTINVVNALRQTGFMPVRADQSRCRVAGKKPFTKHLLRFRHKDDLLAKAKAAGDELVEIILTNAHDRSAAYCLDAGVFRLVCANGLVIKSSDFGSIAIRHSGDIVGEVLRGTKYMVDRAPLIREQVSAWKAINLSAAQRLTLAEAALIQRYGIDEHNNLRSPITPAALLVPRREQDAGSNLWVTTNVVQENLIRGQIEGRATSGRRTQTRAIASINAELDINRGVWSIADVMAEQLALANKK